MTAAMARDALPWTPSAQNFAQHQLLHVTNFWRQGRQATFCLEALPGGCAELKVTFKLPHASDIIPPPSPPPPVPKAPSQESHRPASATRPIVPLFPGFRRGGSSATPRTHVSSRRRKSYRRAVQHRAALAAPSLPPPLPGSLRDACRKALQVKRDNSVSTPSPDTPKPNKRPRSVLSSSPSLPLAQRIRDDMDLLVEEESPSSSPIKETLREPCVPEAPLSLSPVGREAPPPQPLLLLTPSLLSQYQESKLVSPPPLLKSKAPGPSAPEKVKWCVCTALGREVSLVDCGSRCPSCGITATAN